MMQLRLYILLMMLVPGMVKAQSFSSKGRFSVEFNKGCVPLTVNITEQDPFGAVTRQYYFFTGANITNSTTFTYDTPGTYEIVQLIGVDNIGDKYDTLSIEVVESQKPVVAIAKCSNLEVSITSKDTFYDSVRVYFSTTDSVTLEFDETTTYTYPDNSAQTFFLKGLFDNANEICDIYSEEVVPLEALLEPEIVDASIKEACKDAYSLYLQLNEFDRGVIYRIYLRQATQNLLYEGYLDSTLVILSAVPFNLERYCIAIEAYDPCANTTSTSIDFCDDPSELSLSPFESLYSSYEDQSIYINLDPVTSGTFEVYRKYEGGAFELRNTVSGSFYDPIGILSRKYFYTINYVDSCGTTLFSAATHPPLIDAEKRNDNEYDVTLTIAENSLSQLNNSTYYIGTSTEVITANPFDLRLSSTDGIPYQYLSVQSDYNDNLLLHSNTITLKYELEIYVPTAFTPDGDGLNDRLEFFGLPSENARFNIYSRWGKRVYSSEDALSGWDGTINGELAPEGTYLYEISFETTDGQKLQQKGTFALIKK